MHPSFGDGASFAGSLERDSMFFFEAYEATFLVAMTSLMKMLFGLGSLDFGEKMRCTKVPMSMPKIYNYKKL